MKKSNTGRWFLAGIVAVILLGLTTDQIMNNVYDSSNTALRATIVNASGTPVSFSTPTPLVFGTPGEIAIFAATELGRYPGAACTPPALALSQSATGAWTCATPAAAAVPTDTPLANLTYSAFLNVTDIFADSSSFNVADHRFHVVTTGASTITATLPAATGSGRVYDACKVDSGVGTVVVTRAGSDGIINKSTGSATTVTLAGRGACETVYDYASGLWVARGDGT